MIPFTLGKVCATSTTQNKGHLHTEAVPLGNGTGPVGRSSPPSYFLNSGQVALLHGGTKSTEARVTICQTFILQPLLCTRCSSRRHQLHTKSDRHRWADSSTHRCHFKPFSTRWLPLHIPTSVHMHTLAHYRAQRISWPQHHVPQNTAFRSQWSQINSVVNCFKYNEKLTEKYKPFSYLGMKR